LIVGGTRFFGISMIKRILEICNCEKTDAYRNYSDFYQKRIYAEHVIKFVKHFQILLEQYRNQRKRFFLWFSL
ncbi:MAG: hypothetical protein K2H66_03270, partial [Oscillospiraceae bacterium]|nr:hypothetical protein [Oscillospiraceae bacterium]